MIKVGHGTLCDFLFRVYLLHTSTGSWKHVLVERASYEVPYIPHVHSSYSHKDAYLQVLSSS